jgi:signal transduction histidine kinase
VINLRTMCKAKQPMERPFNGVIFTLQLVTLILLLQGATLQVMAQNSSLVDSLESTLKISKGDQCSIVLYELVYAYLRIDIKKAEQHIGTVRLVRQEQTSPVSLAYLEMTEGIYDSRIGLLDTAISHLNSARQFAIDGKSDRALTRIYAALGHAYISSGKPEKGLENMFAGLRVLEKSPDKELELKLRTNIAWAYLELKEYRNCIAYGLQNLKLMEGTSYEWIALYTYNNVAISYGAIDKLDSAKYFIHKGIAAAEKSNDMQSLANGYFILGTIYSNAGQYAQAIEQYVKAKPYREKVGNPLFIVSDLYTISQLYFKSGEFKKGIAAGEEALLLANKYKLMLKFEGTYESLARNYEGIGDFKNASKYYHLWALAKDSVYQNANTTAIAEMRTRFETEKKEQALAIQKIQLAKQSADLKLTYVVIASLAIALVFIVFVFALLRSNSKRERELLLQQAHIHATIHSQENERRRFARDLHDGMGQLISALRIALHGIQSNSTLEERITVVDKAEKLLTEMHQEIRSIAFNLMPQTLIQHGLVPALKEMAQRVADEKTTVKITSLDLPERLTELQEISLYRVIQEWLNNVIKYAHASKIEIQLITHDNEVSILIEDDGAGVNIADLENSKGNGWRNIKSRVKLIQGTIEVDSDRNGNGTTVIIIVPTKIDSSLITQLQPSTA